MTSGLEDLFVQILHSEQRAQERRSLLNEVKQAVLNCQTAIHEVREEQKCMQGQIVTELQRWNDAELELKCAAAQEINLQSQLQHLQEEYKRTETKLQQLKEHHFGVHENFTSDVKVFMTNYDLLSYSNHQRDISLKDAIQELKHKKETLQQKLSVYSRHQDKVDELQQQANNIRARTGQIRAEIAESERAMEKEGCQTKRLEEQKNEIADLPHTSQEYLRLRRELERFKEETLEDYCAALQCELQELQQRLWQKNIRQPPKPAVSAASNVHHRFTSYGCNVSKTGLISKPE